MAFARDQDDTETLSEGGEVMRETYRHPVRTHCCGDCAAKTSFLPVLPGHEVFAAQRLEPGDANGPPTFLFAYFENRPAEFQIRIQLCTNPDTMPAKHATVKWPEDDNACEVGARSRRGTPSSEHVGFSTIGLSPFVPPASAARLYRACSAEEPGYGKRCRRNNVGRRSNHAI
jgi:hypothetical protein